MIYKKTDNNPAISTQRIDTPPGILIGILGGMGPAATIDFLNKILNLTDAECDQDHLPIVVWSNPRIPNRNEALLIPGSPSPMQDLQYGAKQLEAAGATFIAISCNTAHHWYEEMQAVVNIPILHVADIVVTSLREAGYPRGTAVGLMCSDGTLASGYYEPRLSDAGFPIIYPTDEMQHRMMQTIYAVKAGEIQKASSLGRQLAGEFIANGASVLLLGCTELPIALDAYKHDLPPYIDATLCLAQTCVARAAAHLKGDPALAMSVSPKQSSR